jgi:putative ABC transport system substrate-binding protein
LRRAACSGGFLSAPLAALGDRVTTRRRFILTVAFGALAISLTGFAQGSEKVHRIGFLGARFRSTAERPDVYYDGWLAAMRELGYVEGKNLTIEWRFADGDYDRLPGLAAALAGMKLDAIVTHGLRATLELQKTTRVTPIVSAVLVDPIGNHIVPSLARPGGNITGLSLMAEDLNAKRVELMKQLMPSLSRVAVFVNPSNPSHAVMLRTMGAAAAGLGVTIVPVESRSQAEIDGAVEHAQREHVNGLIVLEDAYLNSYQDLVAKSALRRRIPSMGWTPEYVEAGGLVCYGTNLLEFYRRAAILVDKILRGAKPAEIPIEQPTKIELVVNKKTAADLRLTIPPEILVQADKVIE